MKYVNPDAHCIYTCHNNMYQWPFMFADEMNNRYTFKSGLIHIGMFILQIDGSVGIRFEAPRSTTTTSTVTSTTAAEVVTYIRRSLRGPRGVHSRTRRVRCPTMTAAEFWTLSIGFHKRISIIISHV